MWGELPRGSSLIASFLPGARSEPGIFLWTGCTAHPGQGLAREVGGESRGGGERSPGQPGLRGLDCLLGLLSQALQPLGPVTSSPGLLHTNEWTPGAAAGRNA